MPSLLKMVAEIALNVAPFQAGLKQAQGAADRAFDSMGNHLKGMVAGYFGWQALKGAVLDVAKEMANLKDRADQLGLTTAEVQKLAKAADATGLGFEDMAAALQKFNHARAEGKFGDQQGTDLDLIRRMNLNTTSDEQLRDIFGKSGARLRAALKELQQGDDGERLISDDDIEAVDRAEAALKRLSREWKVGVAPAIATASNALADFIATAKKAPDGGDPVIGLGNPKLAIAERLLRFAWGKGKKAAGVPDEALGKGIVDGLQHAVQDALGMIPQQGGDLAIFDEAMVKKNIELRKRVEEASRDALMINATKDERRAMLKKQMAEADDKMRQVHMDLDKGLIKQEEAEGRILEIMLDKVDAGKKLIELQKTGGIGFEAFRRLTAAAGTNPADFKAAEKLLTSIDAKLGNGKIMLGRH